MKKWIVLFLLFCLPTLASAQQINIDLGKLAPERAKQVLEAQQSIDRTQTSSKTSIPTKEQLD
jgi:hypothetical protein